jgi:hypothetical protein
MEAFLELVLQALEMVTLVSSERDRFSCGNSE